MEVVDYYYKILDLDMNTNTDLIYKAYHEKIEKYRNLPYFNSQQKREVKELKRAKCVLTNSELRAAYDEIISKSFNEKNKMGENEKKYAKKEKVNSELINDRIFSMMGITNVPQKNYDVDRQFFSSSNLKSDGKKKTSVNL
jgi:DnaJ-class molecular chaperone